MPDAHAIHVVILAAGKGTRMKSSLPKVLHRLAGRSLIEHVLATVDQLPVASKVLVVGHGADQVQGALAGRSDLRFVVQAPQLGTGHALLQTEPVLKDLKGLVLLLYADVPLLEAGTLSRLIEAHRRARAAATILTAEIDDPYGYGRIVRDQAGAITRIVEERDASAEQQAIREVNSGIYVFSMAPLFENLHRLASDNNQGEYYLTDMVALYRRQQLRVETLCLDSGAELRGVNSRVDLAELAAELRQRKNRSLMVSGVTLEDPASTYVDVGVTVGPDTILAPGVHLEGTTAVGERCRIHAGSRLTNATVEDDVVVLDHSLVVDSLVARGASVGPMAHIRPGSAIGPSARVGNFVELKKTSLGRGSKASHLSYLGDASIGEDVNIGAGTITCNYDGVTKQKTTIEDGVFVGSDSQLIAPVTIGRDAYIAAGSSVTDDVPAEALAISRGRQTIKAGWARGRKTPAGRGADTT